MFKRRLFFAYGVIAYVVFLVQYAWFCAFTGDFAVAKTVDAPVTSPLGAALAIDLALLLAFGLQHSVMARPGFKAVWTRFVPKPIERSTYMYASCAVLGLLMWQWRPISGVIWHVENPAARAAVWALFAAGWVMVPGVSHMINHYDLFGLRQVWLHLRERECTSLPFKTPALYAHIRHPLYVGWAIAFWATPTMTVGHAIFAAALTGYMGLAALVEERDLVAHFGREYEEYQRRVPRYVPRLFGKREATSDVAAAPEAV